MSFAQLPGPVRRARPRGALERDLDVPLPVDASRRWATTSASARSSCPTRSRPCSSAWASSPATWSPSWTGTRRRRGPPRARPRRRRPPSTSCARTRSRSTERGSLGSGLASVQPSSAGAPRGPCRRRRHAQARDPRPPGQGGARRAAPARLRRRHRRPPGQAVRARGRRRGHRRGARRGREDGRDAALQPGDRGLRGPRRGPRRCTSAA